MARLSSCQLISKTLTRVLSRAELFQWNPRLCRRRVAATVGIESIRLASWTNSIRSCSVTCRKAKPATSWIKSQNVSHIDNLQIQSKVQALRLQGTFWKSKVSVCRLLSSIDSSCRKPDVTKLSLISELCYEISELRDFHKEFAHGSSGFEFGLMLVVFYLFFCTMSCILQ